MRCESCDESAIIAQPAHCKAHFIASFEEKIKRTIDAHELIKPGDRVAVAVSGGKDSLTILFLLKRWGYDVTAIAIDEGIAGYREKTLRDAQSFCDKHDVPLIIRTFKELTGHTLDEILAKGKQHPCTVCGTFRRHLLNVAAREFDVLVTGHNADDECQAVLMNVVKGNTELFSRIGPSTHMGDGFTRRVKPLYFCSEKEVATYAFLHSLVSGFTECPNVRESYRRLLRDELNSYAQSHPGVRERILERFLLLREMPHDARATRCSRCGEPSSGDVCKACALLARIASSAQER